MPGSLYERIAMPARPKDPGFVALFTPKLITAFREGYRLGDLRADLVAGLTVAIVALPLSMAIAIASGVSPAQGPHHCHHRRSRHFGTGWQPVSDRRSRRGLHRAGGGDCRAARCRGADPGHVPVGPHPAGNRVCAARHLHQIHPLSGHRRVHRRHRGHHLRQPDQGAVGPDARGQGAGGFRA